ncbi:hypothetical protein O6H91_02G062900 [Diphasiastrum complanatum]|uniref:Uncharacterized protein n=1 Tax=Diphasiastrum complanatum TaxID=34168 RepID=A0ACC2EG12_DIPCM|nr:hypothetical protein O6H91_02G062900 [Diphasiastrum complanatum]
MLDWIEFVCSWMPPMKKYRERLKNMLSVEPVIPSGSKRKHQNTMIVENWVSMENHLLSPFDEQMRSLVIPAHMQPISKVLFQKNTSSFHDAKDIASANIFNFDSGLGHSRSITPFDKRMRPLAVPAQTQPISKVPFQKNIFSFHDAKDIASANIYTFESGLGHFRSVTPLSRSLQVPQRISHSQSLDKVSRSNDGLHRNPSENGALTGNARGSNSVATDALLDAAKKPVIPSICGTREFSNSKFTGLDNISELELYRSYVQAVQGSLASRSAGWGDLSASLKATGSNLQQGPRFSFESGRRTSSIGPSVPGSGFLHFDASNSKDRQVAERTAPSTPVWKKLFNKAQQINPEETVDLEAKVLEAQLHALRLTKEGIWRIAEQRRKSELEKLKKKDVADAFTSLSSDAEEAVESALLSQQRNRILVTHEKSNIDITGAVIQCLLPGAWLNDEVINLYMELLKEREVREPKKFLSCHFFSTFFYNKLFKDKGSYDYKAVRRWTTQKKLGYNLLDCEKILVPIHKDIHWCLAVINIRDRKFEYLDSLKGTDDKVLQVLARYIVDEAKDKKGELLDISSWEYEYRLDIPEQLNGCISTKILITWVEHLHVHNTLVQ